jgi:hypothetical protein
LGVGLTTLSCKKKIVEKPPRNSAGFCGGGQDLSSAVEPRKEEDFKAGKDDRCSGYSQRGLGIFVFSMASRDSGAHTASYLMGTGTSFPQCETDYSCPSSAEVKNAWCFA